MKVILVVVFFGLFTNVALTQQSFRKDSLQVKIYTEMFVNENTKIDSIIVTKVFCDYCSEIQIELIKKEATFRVNNEIYNPKYRKKGRHRIAINLRISKREFSELDLN